MTSEQSKTLVPGQRVRWHDSVVDLGTVSKVDWSGVHIAWDDGKDEFVHHNNMGEVEAVRQR